MGGLKRGRNKENHEIPSVSIFLCVCFCFVKKTDQWDKQFLGFQYRINIDLYFLKRMFFYHPMIVFLIIKCL